MKIAQIVSTFSPHFGGMGMVCEEEADGLSDRGHDVTVFTLRYPQIDYRANFFLFNVERMRPLLKLGDAGVTPQLLSHLTDFDVIHLHYPFYGGAEWVWLAKFLLGKKYFVTYHMHAAPTGWLKCFVQNIYDWFWQKRILAGAEKVLVVDREYWLNLPIARVIPESKVVEFPNGINLKIFRPGVPDWRDIDLEDWRDKKILLFVGNLLPLKRLDLLLQVLADMSGDDWRLVVVGGGYAEQRYKNLSKELGIDAKIKFVGYCLDRDKLTNYYRAAWVTILPTNNESFSLVTIESLASGTPVILSAGSGGENRIKPGENSWTFSPGSVESLRTVLSMVLNLTAEQRINIGLSGRESVLQYSWHNHLDRLEKIYDQI